MKILKLISILSSISRNLFFLFGFLTFYDPNFFRIPNFIFKIINVSLGTAFIFLWIFVIFSLFFIYFILEQIWFLKYILLNWKYKIFFIFFPLIFLFIALKNKKIINEKIEIKIIDKKISIIFLFFNYIYFFLYLICIPKFEINHFFSSFLIPCIIIGFSFFFILLKKILFIKF